MEQNSMTALVSAFARWYHAEHNDTKIFDDSLAGKIITVEEKQQISYSMSSGIKFFNPTFEGTTEEALRWIVDNQLSPSTLGRAAWAEKALQTAVRVGARQYIILAAGYDTFAYRQPSWAEGLRIYEIDQLLMIEDKQKRVQDMGDNPENLTYIPVDLTIESLSEKLGSCSNYNHNDLSFCSLLGITYYLSKKDFKILLRNLTALLSNGSAIVFDYPDEYSYTEQAGERTKKQTMLASGAKEEMLASYSYVELEQLLSDCGFLIDEHLTPDEMTEQYFARYNAANPAHLIKAFDNTNYCLAVKR